MSIKNIAKANSNAKKVDALTKSNKNKAIYGAATTGTSIAAIAAGAIATRHYAKKYADSERESNKRDNILNEYKFDKGAREFALNNGLSGDDVDRYVQDQSTRYAEAIKAYNDKVATDREAAKAKGIKKLNPFKKKFVPETFEGIEYTPIDEWRKNTKDNDAAIAEKVVEKIETEKFPAGTFDDSDEDKTEDEAPEDTQDKPESKTQNKNKKK